MSKLSSNSSEPLYVQLMINIKNDIKNGIYKIGDQLPNEEILGETFGVSRITVRSAITQLVKEGVVVKKRGKGTYVSLPIYVESLSSGGSFSESCIQMKAVPSTVIQSKMIVKADLNISKYLGVQLGDSVIRVIRIRLVNNIETIVELDYFNKDFEFLFECDMCEKPLGEIMFNEIGSTIEKFEDYFSVCKASKEISEMLKCNIGKPLLVIDQIVLGKDNCIIYYNKQYIMSDHYTCSLTTFK